MSTDELAALETVIEDDTTEEVVEEEGTTLALNATEVKTDSDLAGSLDSEDAGLLANLENTLSEAVVATVQEDETIDQNAVQAELDAVLKTSIQKFFLSMGLAVVLEQVQDDASTTDVDETVAAVAITLPAPPHLTVTQIPGIRAFDNRNLRVFKVGPGTLPENSSYAAALSVDADVCQTGENGCR